MDLNLTQNFQIQNYTIDPIQVYDYYKNKKQNLESDQFNVDEINQTLDLFSLTKKKCSMNQNHAYRLLENFK